jgi:hypothetical protein
MDDFVCISSLILHIGPLNNLLCPSLNNLIQVAHKIHVCLDAKNKIMSLQRLLFYLLQKQKRSKIFF